ncbi:MAG: class I SAM-dependent methyltransferase [Wenzhouxiangella sp.]|jgi:SAM-dependent methyltransferase|nr:class I SAM-dependent methyltransferase [Wenzhouxiangella sp.]
MTLPELPDPALRAAADQQLAHARLPGVLHRHCPYLPDSVSPARLATGIHPGCQMLEFSLRHHRDAALSVSQYFAVALQQYQTVRQIIDRVFGDQAELRVLDFACGYGRLLRFLVHSLDPERIWAAEIQPEAVDHVVDRYGVHGLYSSAVPEDFQPDQRFDVIWVASLFSHLPDGLFERWLDRLAGLLKPGGILCFSVHDEVLLPEHAALPDTGLLYYDHSENEGLDGRIYGTSFVSEDYVRAAAASVFGPGLRYRRFGKLLAHEQDVYICTSADGPDLGGLEDFRRGPRGWLDVHRQEGDALVLQGWAASIDDATLESLEIEFAGQLLRLDADEPRPDVARVLGDQRLGHCGFSCRLPWPAAEPEPYLVISALSQVGERGLVFAGQLYRAPS